MLISSCIYLLKARSIWIRVFWCIFYSHHDKIHLETFHLFKVSPDSSSSSANWPSILNTNSLKEQAAYNPYKDVGKRPRDPLPCEVDDGTDDSNEAMKHQHTHHHYHHYEAAQVSRSKRTTAVSPGKSSLKEARADSLKRLSSERGSFSAKQNSTNCDKNKAGIC